MARTPRIPSYRRHSSGQARVTIGGKDHLLGRYGSAASRETYRRVVAEWLIGPAPRELAADRIKSVTITELVLVYWKFCKRYYGFAADKRRGDRYCLRSALRLVRSLYGRTLAADFGPLALKACRQKMVDLGWSRTYVNAQVDRVRRMFRWAAEEELLPANIYQNLRAVTSLRFGRTEARETAKVRPVPEQQIETSLPFMPPAVAAMVRFQLLTGCRPAEVCVLRPIDLDVTDPSCWVYRPSGDRGPHGRHKTAHHGRDRLVFVGPKAQEVLRPFMSVRPGEHCFSPTTSEAQRHVRQRAARRSPLTPSQAACESADRRRPPRDTYDTHSYRRAIARACRKADKAVHRDDLSIPEGQVIIPTWGPNRLRHNRATELRPFGLDMTKTVLGHAKVETTQLYAEKDVTAAMRLVGRIG